MEKEEKTVGDEKPEEKRDLIQVCTNSEESLWLAVDAEGMLRKREGRSGIWKEYDFNQEYSGYYPPCRFTAVAWCGSSFLAAGVEESGAGGDGKERIVAYSSLRGGVWQPENLTAYTPDGPRPPRYPVSCICADSASGQIFLLGGKGQVITLTGCPKCVKAARFTDKDIVAGQVEGSFLRLTFADGSRSEVALSAALQLRLSWEAAERKREEGALLVDVGSGSEEEEAGSRIPAGIPVPVARLNAFLKTQDKGRTMVFFCRSGIRAEAAAKSARAQGFSQAYFAEGISRGGKEPERSMAN